MTPTRPGSRILVLLTIVTLLALELVNVTNRVPTAAAEDSRYFPETQHTISGKFLTYWEMNGGLAVYGYPITDAQMEVDPETGRSFLTQWFERNRFELHPENAGTQYEVLLGLLGKDLRREALAVDPDFQPLNAPPTSTPNLVYFPEVKHTLRGGFLSYWQQHGGLTRFGYPIAEEHEEVDPETGKVFKMQWFERARFEYHPENKAPYDILLGLVGNQLKTPHSKVDFAWKLATLVTQEPSGITTDTQNNLYIVSTLGFNAHIKKFDNAGKELLAFGPSQTAPGKDMKALSRPTRLVLDKQGNINVVDNNISYLGKFNPQIVQYDANGNFLKRWGSTGADEGQFGDSVDDMGIDSKGVLYLITNDQVQKYDSEDHYLGKWGTKGSEDGQLNHPVSLAIDSQDNLYIGEGTPIDGPSQKVEKFDRDGKYLGQKWTNPHPDDKNIYFPAALAVDKLNNLYILDLKGTFYKYDGHGNLIYVAGGSGEANGLSPAGGYANGITVDQKLNVFVTMGSTNGYYDQDRVTKYVQH